MAAAQSVKALNNRQLGGVTRISGFVAIVSHNRGRPIDSGELAQLAAAYESLRPGGRHETAFAEQWAALVKIDTPTADRPGIERAGASWAVSAGVVQGSTPLVEAAVDQLEGQFGIVRYDAKARRIDIITDPLGQFSIYTADRDDKTYLSTSALALAKHLRPRPDPYALSVFLRAGFHFGAMTNWREIVRLEPATIATFLDGRRDARTYFVPAVDEAVARLGFKQTVDYCLETLLESYRAHYGHKPRAWSDLTGGYDTRLTNAAFFASGVDFHANTVGGFSDPDVRLAHTVADRAGWDWTQFSLPQNWDQVLPERLTSALGWGDGHLEVLQLAEVLHMHAEKSLRYPALFVGSGTEYFRDSSWRQEFWGAGTHNKVNFGAVVDLRWLRPVNTTIFARDPTQDVREDFRARALTWLAPYQGAPNTVQLDILYLRKNGDGVYRSAADGFIRTTLPFYSRPIFTAAVSANFRHRNGRRLMRHMIERLNPAVARVETTHGGPAQPWRITNLHRFAPYYTRLARKATSKLSQKFLGRAFLGPDPRSPGKAAARRSVLDHLALRPANMRTASLFNPPAIERFLRDAGDPNFSDGAMLGRIITAELALRETGTAL